MKVKTPHVTTENNNIALVKIITEQGTGHEVNPQSWTQHLLFICEEEH